MKKIMMALGVCGLLGACDAQPQGAQNGDTVVINFAGFLDGVQFPGGTAENFPLTLGSGQFVPGFEDQVVGMTEGEERDINITFPTEYVPELAGKDVGFKVNMRYREDHCMFMTTHLPMLLSYTVLNLRLSPGNTTQPRRRCMFLTVQ